ncbi:MAG: DNA topoisomerase IB [Hyphomicrobiaceae bacterium]
MLDPNALPAGEDPREAAHFAGLEYVNEGTPGIRRRRSGRGFRYEGVRGEKITDAKLLARIKALAIPPAWTDVWICATAAGHIQATGRDARGRKQYRYHARFRQLRESTKYQHMLAFAEALPGVREKIAAHLSLRGLKREKVLATVAHLLEATLIRVGSDEYARSNKSYGLTTLEHRHVEVRGSHLKFRFKGKSGKTWMLDVRDRRIANVVRACQELPGQELFQFVDEDGVTHDITSSDVNDYLREISGSNITAKDFRTWHGTVLAARALAESEWHESQAKSKRGIRAATEQVAAALGNTPAICRKCYIHPEIITCYIEGALKLDGGERPPGAADAPALGAEEAAVLRLLRSRLGRRLEDQLQASLEQIESAC